MVTFSARAPGTPETAWAKSDRLRALPALSLGEIDRVVVISAHPDDETLGAGGLIAGLAATQIPVTFVVATNGEASHPDSPTHSAIELRHRRRAEIQAAAAILAPGSAVTLVKLPDGRLDEYIVALRDAILIAADEASNVLMLAPWHGDRHPDHRAAAEAARSAATQQAATLLEYPVWFWHWAQPNEVTAPWPLMRRHGLTEVEQQLKAEALRQFRSQTAPLSSQPGDEAVIDQAGIEYFRRDFEVFVVTENNRG